MKKYIPIFLLLFCSINILPVSAAIQVVECEDEQGIRSFQKNCPPGSTIVSKKKYQGNNKSAEQPKLDITHYFTKDCGACDQVRDFFKLRKIEIVEKNVNDDIKLQGELSLLVGELRVPTVVIGDEVIQGFNRDKMLETLKKAGFKEEEN